MPLTIDPMTEEHRARLLALPGFIVLARQPGHNTWTGLCEASFSMELSKDRTQFHFTSDNATSNLGGSFKVDGRRDAEREVERWRRGRPDWTFEIFDARDEEALPVILDWERWLLDHRPCNKLSGVASKYGARNILFKPKD